jgi:hypothetical protein
MRIEHYFGWAFVRKTSGFSKIRPMTKTLHLAEQDITII